MNLAPLAPGAARVWTLPAGTGFLSRLAQGLASAVDLASDPGALAQALIFVPNARSARALALALLQAGGRDGLIAPDIRALGDLPGETPSAMLSGVGLDLPLAAPPAQRLGLLARLAGAWADRCGLPAPAPSRLAMARELAGLLDQIAQQDEGSVDWAALENAILEAGLSSHWQDSARFMDILRTAWPDILHERGWGEAEALRRAAADALANHWADTPPPGPVILAGSTGTHPATRTLMRAIASLPQGLVVLPGLDTHLSPDALKACHASPSHPQHALAVTLDALAFTPDQVALWPAIPGLPAASPERAPLLAAALAPAEDTADWLDTLDAIAVPQRPAAFVRDALSGLTLIEAADEEEEARACAVLMRQGLEAGDGLTALITPDAAIGRRVAAELSRWGLDISPSAGTPLLRTPAGALLSLTARWLCDPADPVALAALLDHPHVRLNRSHTDHRAIATAIEVNALRGPRVWQHADGLLARIAAADADTAHGLEALLSATATHTHDTPVRARCEALATAIETLCASPEGSAAWRGPDGGASAALIRDLADYGDAAGPVPASAFPALLEAFAEEITLPDPEGSHPRLAIWGPLEARLQDADRVILAGLNEGLWPQPPGSGQFLPRGFRIRIGLPDPEARIGLSAHDFSQLACAPEVFLLRARRVDNQPSVASRWLWRLRTLSTGALNAEAETALGTARARDTLALARALDRKVANVPEAAATAPRPRPLPEHRPKRFRVTEIETLIRDPYAIYAGKVLGLQPLDAVGAPFSARERGTALHKAVEVFAKDAPPYGPPSALLALMQEELAKAGMAATDLRAAGPLLSDLADALTVWLNSREPDTVQVERQFDTPLTTPAGIFFQLRGCADRIETFSDGSFALFDFKSGQPPSADEVAAGLAPQLPLLAALLRLAEPDLTPRNLAHVVLKRTFEEKTAIASATDPETLVTQTWERLQTLLALWLDTERAYLSNPIAKWAKKRGGDYDRLARRSEWADLGYTDSAEANGAEGDAS